MVQKLGIINMNGLDFWYQKAKKLEKENDSLKIMMIMMGCTFGEKEDIRLSKIAVKSKKENENG